MVTAMPTTVTGDQLRKTVGTFPSGVTVITTVDEGTDIGLTVSSFASLSLDPAMVMFSIAKTSANIGHFRQGAKVGISVLADDQADLAWQFSRRAVERFDGVDTWRNSEAKLLSGASAWFDGDIAEVLPGGDHLIFTVNVTACGADPSSRPLLYLRGQMVEWG